VEICHGFPPLGWFAGIGMAPNAPRSAAGAAPPLSRPSTTALQSAAVPPSAAVCG
jgi:hypothetical protein